MATEFRRMQQIRGSTSDWAANDIILLLGEIGVEMTVPPRFKVGNGTDVWSALPYAGEVDTVARAAITVVETDIVSLDTRVDALEGATAGLGALQTQADAATADILLKLDDPGDGANAGDLMMWDGGTPGAWQPVLLTLGTSSLLYWDGTQYVATNAGSPGQALVLNPSGVPVWTTNPAAGVEEAPNDGLVYGRQSEAWAALPPPMSMSVLDISTTTRTLVASDAGKRIRSGNVAGCTVTIPTNAAVPFPIGTVIEFMQNSAGNVILDPDTGVTLNHRASVTPNTSEEFAVCRIVKEATNVWTADGDLT